MAHSKKNLTFTVFVCICVLAFVAGAYLVFVESRDIGQAKQKIKTAQADYTKAIFDDPAPTEANLVAAKENLEQLSAELDKMRADLERGARMPTSTDGVGVMASIQQYISDFQRKAATNTDDDGELAPIALPQDFAFGFEQYAVDASPLQDESLIKVLDKQRQILSYLLNKLYDANPESIVSVKREVLEEMASDERSRSGGNKFSVNPAISAKVPGAIDTLGFALTFTGYTDSLREFLNDLAKFDLPIVVRSIEVERAAAQVTTVAAPEKDSLDAIFGVLSGDSTTAEPTAEETNKLVISENTSKFTVVLEFIEIVLPADSGEDNL